jgi:hypothetical protein
MARGIAMITDTCRQPGDGAAVRAYVVTYANRTGLPKAQHEKGRRGSRRYVKK